jgi:sphingoid base N-palmitoyltransferase
MDFRTVHVGVPVMLLHDASDPFMEAAKAALYCNYQNLANIFFVIFSCTFMLTRDFIYPICIIAPLYYSAESAMVKHIELYIAALSVIGVLNFFWTYLILSMIKRNILSGDVKGDIRED